MDQVESKTGLIMKPVLIAAKIPEKLSDLGRLKHLENVGEHTEYIIKMRSKVAKMLKEEGLDISIPDDEA